MRQDGHQHCEDSLCTQRGLKVRARVVDHIQSIADGGDVFDPANHQSLCVACNTRKG
jgi:5-methylcytosine-specific restriction endonuclease McrA